MNEENHDVHDGTRPETRGQERLFELLADRAVFGLDAAEEAELTGLLRGAPAGEDFDRLAASVAVATVQHPVEDLPAALRGRLEADLGRLHAAPAVVGLGRAIRVAAGALLATAVGLLLLMDRRNAEPRPPVAPVAQPAATLAATPAVQREELLATVPDAVRLDCAAAADDGPASGDVVWSPSRQRGFLRIGGLAANDPAESRYQVWIIDGDRGAPVPGGLFDVTAAGEVVVPILPRGFVQGPTMFAITREPAAAGRDAAFDRERVVVRSE